MRYVKKERRKKEKRYSCLSIYLSISKYIYIYVLYIYTNYVYYMIIYFYIYYFTISSI